MNISLESLVQIITIIGFAGGVVNYVVVRPLKDAVNTLSKSLDRLEQVLSEVKEREITLEQRVAHNEESVKTAHKRIDRLEQYHKKPIE